MTPALQPADLLAAHDQDLRTQAELDGADETSRIGPLWLGRWLERGFITYRDLDGATGERLDALIAAAVRHFTDDQRVVRFEWKTRGHDLPADLGDHLERAGLRAADQETVMIGESTMLAMDVPLPLGAVLRRVGDAGDLEADVASVGRLHRAVFGPASPNLDAVLLHDLLQAGDRNELWLVEAEGAVVSTGRLTRVPGTRFAGLFGGATDFAWRGRGLYRALTAARARSALAMGASLVYAECTEYSRPVLARAGLVKVATTTPYLWSRPPA